MYACAGLRVHALTSPHLVRFAERIRIAGELITDARLTELPARVEAANAGEPISFFEITTVLALQAFAKVPADLCLIEVGLGGRRRASGRRPCDWPTAAEDHGGRGARGEAWRPAAAPAGLPLF